MWDFYSVVSWREARLLRCVAGLLLLCATVARADSYAYEVSGDGYFGTIDLQTGHYTGIGSQPLQEMGGNNLSPTGLAEVGGGLYVAERGTGLLYSVNPLTGTDTYIGDGSRNYFLIGSTNTGVYGLASLDIYGDAELFSVNTTTGATTDIAEVSGATLGLVDSLSTGSDTLYLTTSPLNDTSSTLYSINITTGVATEIGDNGTDMGQEIRIGALVDENGTLYGGEDDPNLRVVTLNTSPPGGATLGPSYDGESAVGDMAGFAPGIPAGSSTPLPNAAVAGLTLLAGLGISKWGRRSKRQMVS